MPPFSTPAMSNYTDSLSLFISLLYLHVLKKSIKFKFNFKYDREILTITLQTTKKKGQPFVTDSKIKQAYVLFTINDI